MLVGIGGYAESGKDALADFMVEHDPRWKKTYMSYSLEMALLALDPYVPVMDWHGIGRLEEWERYSVLHARVGYNASKKNPEVRRLLQMLGTEVGRNMFGQDVWIEKMLEIVSTHPDYLVTAIRFRNELRAIEARDGVTVWVSRPGVGPVNAHRSDNELGPEDFMVIIENNGSLANLAKMAAGFSDNVTTYKERNCTPR